MAFTYTNDSAELLFDGNSLMYGFGVAGNQTVPAQVQTMQPANGVLCRNFGVSGINITTMRNKAATTVDTKYAPGQLNILFAWEATNTAWGNKNLTGEDIALQMKAYCQERLAVFPGLKIVLMTTLPRYNTDGAWGANLAAGNAVLAAYNAYIKTNYRDMGASYVLDVRASGVFEYTGPTMKPEMAPYYQDLIHLTAGGNTLIAQMISETLTQIAADQDVPTDPPDPPGPTTTALRLTGSGRIRLANGKLALTRS